MRTEQEIETAINKLATCNPESGVPYTAEQAVESCIAWLQWVLGKREEPNSYVCSVHRIIHPQKTCPKCERERKEKLTGRD